jgi:uncharacterized protein (TIGR03437 family)
MFRKWLFLAALSAGVVWGDGPTYSADSIVNGANFAPGPFAPNSIITIFGSNLAFNAAGVTANTTNTLPTQLSDVRVYVNNTNTPLIYVCPTQINLVIPSNLKAGTVPIRVVRQGLTGPEISLTLVDAAPQLFADPNHYVLAQHGADYSQITPDSPAVAGETIVVYATGLGRTLPNAFAGEIDRTAAPITSPLQIALGGVPFPSDHIEYAGLTPGTAGVYQLNLMLPDDLPAGDLEIIAGVGAQTSIAGVSLPTQSAPAAQPSSGGTR